MLQLRILMKIQLLEILESLSALAFRMIMDERYRFSTGSLLISVWMRLRRNSCTLARNAARWVFCFEKRGSYRLVWMSSRVFEYALTGDETDQFLLGMPTTSHVVDEKDYLNLDFLPYLSKSFQDRSKL